MKSLEKHIARQIKIAREEAGLNQATLGALIGVSLNQISKYERCIDKVFSGRLYDIATITGKPIEWFFPE